MSWLVIEKARALVAVGLFLAVLVVVAACAARLGDNGIQCELSLPHPAPAVSPLQEGSSPRSILPPAPLPDLSSQRPRVTVDSNGNLVRP